MSINTSHPVENPVTNTTVLTHGTAGYDWLPECFPILTNVAICLDVVPHPWRLFCFPTVVGKSLDLLEVLFKALCRVSCWNSQAVFTSWHGRQWITASGVWRVYVLKCCVWVTLASLFRVCGVTGFTWEVESFSFIINYNASILGTGGMLEPQSPL